MNRAVKVIFVIALMAAAYWAAQTSATRFFTQNAAPRAAPRTASQQAPPAATRSESRPAAPDTSDRLPGESTLLTGSELNAEALGAIIRSDRYTQVLDQMSRDASSDADAAELTQVFEDAIRAQLGSSPVVALERIACGLRLCALRFAGGDDEHAWLAWLERFRNDPQTPHGALVESRVEARPGVFERRVVFSTDPAPAP
jgi:hypothetical protein